MFEYAQPYLIQMMASNITTTRSHHVMGLLPLAGGRDDGGPSYNLRASVDVTADVDSLTFQLRYLHATNGVTFSFSIVLVPYSPISRALSCSVGIPFLKKWFV